jgi:hypothetical protein
MNNREQKRTKQDRTFEGDLNRKLLVIVTAFQLDPHPGLEKATKGHMGPVTKTFLYLCASVISYHG